MQCSATTRGARCDVIVIVRVEWPELAMLEVSLGGDGTASRKVLPRQSSISRRC